VRCRAGAPSKSPSGDSAPVSNLVFELLLRLVKPLIAVVLGALVYFVATALGESGSITLALLSFVCGAAFILLVQEGPI
jgi:hypothetical protein